MLMQDIFIITTGGRHSSTAEYFHLGPATAARTNVLTVIYDRRAAGVCEEDESSESRLMLSARSIPIALFCYGNGRFPVVMHSKLFDFIPGMTA